MAAYLPGAHSVHLRMNAMMCMAVSILAHIRRTGSVKAPGLIRERTPDAFKINSRNEQIFKPFGSGHDCGQIHWQILQTASIKARRTTTNRSDPAGRRNRKVKRFFYASL